MAKFLDLLGTSLDFFRVGLSGPRLKNQSGTLAIRDAEDTADAPLTAKSLRSMDGDLILGSGSRLVTLRPAAGQSAPYTLVIPPDDGTPNQALLTDGAGLLFWATMGGSSDKVGLDSTALEAGAGATVPMFSLPAGAVLCLLQVVIDEPFNGTPSLSIGISGQTAKYMAATSLNLTAAATTIFENSPGLAPNSNAESLIASYSSGGATAGAARILTFYATPS